MGIYNIFIVSKSGGLIYHYDGKELARNRELEQTYSYPLDIRLKNDGTGKIRVDFGGRDGVKNGHALLQVNGQAVGQNGSLPDGRDVLKMVEDEANYPLSLKFARSRVTTNEKIVLASMFYPLYALAVQLSPETGSSGIKELETDTFK